MKIQIFKDPITDNGTKKSAKGAVRVFEKEGSLAYQDELSLANAEKDTLLRDVFVNGYLLVDDKFSEIRDRLAGKVANKV